MVNETINDMKAEMKTAIEAMEKDFSRMRTGRANLAILDGIKVDYYGAATPLNQVAALSTPEPRLIMIKPWEKSMVAVIEKAIQAGDLGLNPNNDGEVVRIPIPPLTEERRKDLVKMVKSMGEDYKVQVRRCRRDANDMLKSLEKDKDISEDDLHRAMEKVQQHTDDFVKKVDERIEKKEKEILEI